MQDIRFDNDIQIFSSKLLSRSTMMIYSDIHYFSHEKQEYLLTNLEEMVINCHPDFLCFPGDIFDTSDVLFNNKEIEYIMNWFKRLSRYTTIIIIIGNHELMALRNGKWEGFEDIARERLDTLFKDNTGRINLLTDKNISESSKSVFNDYSKGISFRGLDLSFKVYEEHDYEDFTQTVNSFMTNLNINDNLFNMLLFHPNLFINNGKIDNTVVPNYTFDFTIDGHNHGGLLYRRMALLLDHFSNRHRGLIGFKKEDDSLKTKYLTTDCYGTVIDDNKAFLDSRGITKISDSKGAIKIFNGLFKPDIDKVEFVPSEDKESGLYLVKK